MAITKPEKPTINLPESFGGEKENFSSSLIENGFEPDVPQILGGANLNNLIDGIGKGYKYNSTISDFINDMPIARTLTVNSNNKLDYVQYAIESYDSNKTYRATEWVVGSVNGRKAIYESLVNDNIGNALNNASFWQEVTMKISGAGSGTFRNIGEIVFSVTPIDDETLKLLDGSLITPENIPEDFLAYIQWLQVTAPNCFVNESTWQSQVAAYGECGKFVYNAETGVRLPKITGIVQGTNTFNELGSLIQAGLPNINHTHTRGTMNITGSLSGAWLAKSSMSGAFSSWQQLSKNVNGVEGGGNIGRFTLGFDASNGWTGSTSTNSSVSSIYGNSNTVQPQTIKGYYYITYTNLGIKNNYAQMLDDRITELDEMNAELQERIDNLASVYTPKGSVETYYDLPSFAETELGFVYNVLENGRNYACALNENDEKFWDDLGGNVDLSNYYTKSEINNLFNDYYNKSEIDTKLLEIESGDIDVSQQISSVVDSKFVWGTGLTHSDSLKTNVEVSSSNDNLAITSSYTGTQTQTGKITYVFTYNGNNWIDRQGNIVDLLNDYYLTVTGTPQIDDTITLVYNTITKTTVSATFDSSTLGDVAFSNDYEDLDNKPTIPIVSDVYNSSSTNAMSGIAVASAISTKEDKNISINTLNTSGTITLTDNSINKIEPTANIAFTLPSITNTSVFHQILIQLNLSTVVSLTLGTSNIIGTLPDLSETGVFNIFYEYRNDLNDWCVGILQVNSNV